MYWVALGMSLIGHWNTVSGGGQTCALVGGGAPHLTTEQHAASPIQFPLAVSLAPSDVCFRPVRLMAEKTTIDTMRPGQSGSF